MTKRIKTGGFVASYSYNLHFMGGNSMIGTTFTAVHVYVYCKLQNFNISRNEADSQKVEEFF